jgi:CheY-like chemotaxis protein
MGQAVGGTQASIHAALGSAKTPASHKPSAPRLRVGIDLLFPPLPFFHSERKRSLKEPAMKREHLTILLVDDEPDDLFIIEHAFRAAGIEDPIRLVSCGQEAIAYLQGEGKFADRAKYEFPSIILTDLKMPCGDGFAVLEEMRSNPEWAVIPTAVLSGSADEDDIKRAYLLGAKAYLTKPGNPKALQAMLHKFHQFWTMVEVPRINPAGEMLDTTSRGKMGERFVPEIDGRRIGKQNETFGGA